MALSLLTLQFRIIGPKYELVSNSELTQQGSATGGPCSYLLRPADAFHQLRILIHKPQVERLKNTES